MKLSEDVGPYVRVTLAAGVVSLQVRDTVAIISAEEARKLSFALSFIAKALEV